MKFAVSKVYPEYDFVITGASYAGAPRDNTMMYITKKVEHLVENLRGHENCLCFVDTDTNVPADIEDTNAIIHSANPAYTYAVFASEMEKETRRSEREYGYTMTPDGYYVGHNAVIGEKSYIEPGVVIGHNVLIGDNAVIMAGCVIKNATIGDDFLCNENAVVGARGFTMATDDNNNKFRIPTLGRVVIGNHVEVGSHDNISCGSASDTVIEDYVKIDALVHIGHDAKIGKNTEITACSIIGGFDSLGENTFIGLNSILRNRIEIGDDAFIGMGAVVTKSVDNGITVAGNPAKLFNK